MTGSVNQYQGNYMEFIKDNPIIIIVLLACIIVNFIAMKGNKEIKKLNEEQKLTFKKWQGKRTVISTCIFFILGILIIFLDQLKEFFNSELFNKIVNINVTIYILVLYLLFDYIFSYIKIKKIQKGSK